MPKKSTTTKKTPGKKQGGAKKAQKSTSDIQPVDAVAESAAPIAKKSRRKKADAGSKKLSQLDAAAKVLAGAKEPMTTKEMVEAMADQGLWTSPGGKTPHATLYSAILREINAKGKEARFVKTERGKFAAKA